MTDYSEYPFIHLVDKLKKKYSEDGDATIIEILKVSEQLYTTLRKVRNRQTNSNYGESIMATSALVNADASAKPILQRMGVKHE